MFFYAMFRTVLDKYRKIYEFNTVEKSWTNLQIQNPLFQKFCRKNVSSQKFEKYYYVSAMESIDLVSAFEYTPFNMKTVANVRCFSWKISIGLHCFGNTLFTKWNDCKLTKDEGMFSTYSSKMCIFNDDVKFISLFRSVLSLWFGLLCR